MDDSKLFLLVAGMTAFVVFLFIGLTHIRTVFPARTGGSLLAGQTMQIRNPGYSNVDVHSEYPIDVRDGSCYFRHVADVHLDCPPSDLWITDDRPALLIWARANHVTVTAR